MSGIRIDGALGRTVRKRDTVSLERFDSRIGYERAKILLTKLRHFCCSIGVWGKKIRKIKNEKE